MTDYVKALHEPTHVYHREAVRLADQLKDEGHSTLSGGVIRWLSNGNVPPSDVVALAASIFPAVDVDACTAARNKEQQAFIDAYRRNHDRPATEEERFELRAAFGPGARVVNIITGRVTKV
jgi:hypothetical protein